LRLQHLYPDAGTVDTQPPKPDSKVREASQVTPTKWPLDSYMEDMDSGLSSDNNSKPPTKNSDSKRPAKKKPIELTRATKVGRPAEKHQETDEESSSNDFQADATDPDYVDEDPSVDENPSIAEEVQDVPQDPNAAGVADDDDSVQLTSHPRIRNQHQPDNVINPCLPKPKMKYETISICNFRTNEEAPKKQAYLLFERIFPNSSLNPNPKMGIHPLQIPSTKLVDGFLRENIGSLFINGLKKRSHYEVRVLDYLRYKKFEIGAYYTKTQQEQRDMLH
jgi:hypothetical protein